MTSDTAPSHSEARPEAAAVGRFDVAAVLLLTLLWLIPLFCIGISGNFPLNDDWAYVRATQRLIETGLIERTAWTFVPAITHSYLGAAALWLGSPPLAPLEALRCVGVFMGWIGMLGAYALARQVAAMPLPSAIAAAAVGLNPVYLNLSYTYMTDLPFSALCCWSLVFLARGVRRSSWAWVLAGATLALAATLTRQTGMALPLAFGVAVAVSWPWRMRAWGMAAAAGALIGGAYLTALEFAYGPGDARALFELGDIGVTRYPGFHLVKNGLVTLTYMGCFLAPITLLPGIRGALRSRWIALLGVVFVAACVALVVRLGLPMPPGINIIHDRGLGPHWIEGWEALPVAGSSFWWIITALGLAAAFGAGARLVFAASTRFREILQRPDWLLLLAFPAVFIAPHLVRAPYFDRYLLPTLAPLAAALLVLPRWSGRPGRAAVASAAVVLSIFGVAGTLGTRDVVERHRTGHVLLDELTRSGVEPHRIDGGRPFNGLHSFEPRMNKSNTFIIWRYFNDDEFKLSFLEEREGYTLVSANSFSRLLPPGTETIRLFRRDASTEDATGEGRE